ncbi:MAG TPA: hypothetical protein VIO61_13745 [Anaerolineaceae bacterium]
MRLFWFSLVLVIGAAAGLAFGWLVKPAGYANTTPDTLRQDYKTDYVLMIAEAYKNDGDLYKANKLLAEVGSQPSSRIVAEAILEARRLDYDQPDIETLARLSQALQGQPGLSSGSKP